MKQYLFSIISILTLFNGKAQTNQDFKPDISFFPKSPDVAAFSKLVDIPSTTHTGVITKSIPLYTLEFKDISIPISLDYSTSGIKLDEISSRVGLGWSLNIGGISLSKQIFGSNDERTGRKFDVSMGFNPDGFSTVNGNDTHKALLAVGYYMGEDVIDFLPDLFNFSIINNSGKFIYDINTNKALLIPSNSVTIENHSYYTIITNELGYQFKFQKIQSTYNFNTCTSHVSMNYPNDDYIISEIISPQGDRVNFEYTENQKIEYGTSVVQKKILSEEIGPHYLRLPITPPKCYNYSSELGSKLLSRISYKNTSINFNYSNNRKDIINDKYLSSITVYSSNNLIKNYELENGNENGYFISSGEYNYNEKYLKGNNYRLKLIGLTETLANERYKFQYYEGDLPPRLVDKKDFWGVYNGKNNNLSIPSIKYFDYQYNTYRVYNTTNDLSADLNFGKIGNLKSITYPTGGVEKYEYENDDFIVPDYRLELYNDLGIVKDYNRGISGTLRISKISIYDENNEKKLEKKFTYVNPLNNITSGINYGSFNLSPVKKDVLIASMHYVNPTRKFYNYLTNNPGWQLSTVNGKSVGYTHVQEYSSDDASKIEYEYVHDPEFMEDDWSTYNDQALVNLSYPLLNPERGLLKHKTYFNNLNQKVKHELYEYEFDNYFNRESSIDLNHSMLYKGIEIARANTSCAGTCYHEFEFIPFEIKTFWIKNKKTITNEYLSNGQFNTTIENNYSPSYKHLYPLSTITHNSKGEPITTEYKYPADLASNTNSIWDKMVERNMIATPVETKVSNNTTVLSEQRTKFNYYPGTGNTQLILPQYVYAKKGAMGTDVNNDDRKITYNSYDNQGNLTQYTVENGIPVSIIWGYNGQYPIAKIEGTSYEQISSSFIEELINLSNQDNDHCSGVNSECNEARFRKRLNEFRSNGLFVNSMVTVYTYDPLIGVTSIMQPNGITEYYKYDAANRLQEIKNDQGEVLKKFEYNYAQP
ncbi:hypothetical protein [Faecalibacter sp. LW9]|uniref:hypothetical protein n=1 Tax=Faecalibacter sp. LW9 TaxID=3103144 RepID=UPI002AFF0178|nr:hypothetical protein [Faecalibacter sp. LW9]